MKKIAKSTLALFLCLLMLVSASSLAFAATDESQKYPVIIIPGFGQSETKVYDDNGEYMGDISTFSLPGLDVGKIVKALLIPGAGSILTKHDTGISKAVAEYMGELFKPFSINDDGTPTYNRVVREFNQPYGKLSEEDRKIVYHHVSIDALVGYDDIRYFYTYDSFGSIDKAADGLHDYLHNVLEQTGADKVHLVPISQGGTVFINFLQRHPEDYKYLKKVISTVPAFNGSQIVGDIMTDNVRIYDMSTLHNEVLPALLPDGDTAYQISLALRLGLSSKTAENILRAALEQARKLLVQKSTMMWALCPSKEYEQTKGAYLACDPKLAAIYDEAERYAEARRSFPENLQRLMDSGVVCHIVASYDHGHLLASLFDCYNQDADELIAPSGAGLGTTTAPLSGTLGDDYVSPHTYCNNPNHNHISPDNKLDASTGRFPENTWFFKGVQHSKLNSRSDCKDFIAKLIMDDSVVDVHTCKTRGQFINPTDYRDDSRTRKEVSDDSTYYTYYDTEGNYMYGESIPNEKAESVSIWKLMYKAVNMVFSVFDRLGL